MAESESILPPSCPAFTFAKYQVDSFDVPCATNIANQPEAEFKYRFVATGAIVIESHPTTPAANTNSNSDKDSPSLPQPEPKVLLLQRSLLDSMPGRWEMPGGACDPEDATVLHGVARELWEEAGLKATGVGPLVGGTNHVFLTSTRNLVCKLSFLVDVERNGGIGEDGEMGSALEVKLDPREHQAYVWATEHEVKMGWVGDVELCFTEKQVMYTVLEAFKVNRELQNLAG